MQCILPCASNRVETVLPCRNFCLAAREGCEELMNRLATIVKVLEKGPVNYHFVEMAIYQ